MTSRPGAIDRVSPALEATTFLAAPAVTAGTLERGQLAVLGVPHDVTKISRPGAADGPSAIRAETSMFAFVLDNMSDGEIADIDSGSVFRYRRNALVDAGDVELTRDPMQNVEAIAAAVEWLVRAGAVPVVLGGDHLISYPVVLGITRADVNRFAYLHVDMHLDLADDIPGFGRLASGTPVRRAIEDGALAPDRVIIFGVDYAQPRNEVEYAREQGITAISGARVTREGVEASLRPALARALDGASGLYVSFDIDVLARAYAPGTGNTVGASGLEPRHVIEIATIVSEQPLLGLDLVEVSPRWDPTGRTAGLAVAILMQALWPRLFDELEGMP